MADPTEQLVEIPLAGVGMNPMAFDRSMGVNGLYDLNNLMPDAGGLQRRPGVTATGWGPSTWNHPKQERPVNLWIYPVGFGFFTAVLLTTRSLYHRHSNGTWRDLTPTYSTGTVSITSGTTALNGTGTLWLSSAAALADMTVKLSGVWYTVASVNSDTSITLATAYGGGTLSGAAYTMNLNWNLENPNGFNTDKRNPDRGFAVRLNSDVYVCGRIGTDVNFGASASPIYGGAIIKITNGAIYDSTTVPTSAFMVSGVKALASGAATALGYTWFPRGFDVLEDGRLVIAMHWLGNGVGGATGAQRIAYSSNTNLTVWNTTPGGFADLTMKNGEITGLGRIGRTRTVHFQDGVVLAELTGQDDPPLNFTDSRARVGAMGPWTLLTLAEVGGQMYVARDQTLRIFNGDTDQEVDSSFRYMLQQSGVTNTTISPTFQSCTVCFNPIRGEFRFAYRLAATMTVEIIYNVRTKQLSHFGYDNEYSLIQAGRDTAVLTGYPETIIGIPSKTDAGASNPNAICYASATAFLDSETVTLPSPITGGFSFTTDVLDFGQPGIFKTITRIGLVLSEVTSITADTNNIDVEVLAGNVPVGFGTGGGTVIASRSIAPWWYTANNFKWFTVTPSSSADSYRIRVSVNQASGDGAFYSRFVKLIIGWVPTGDMRSLG